MWDGLMVNVVINDFIDFPAAVLWFGFCWCGMTWMEGYGHARLKRRVKAWSCMIAVTIVISAITTVFNIPELTIEANVKRAKLECFSVKNVEDVNIIKRRLEGAGAINNTE